MPYKLEFRPAAVRALRKLPEDVQQRVRAATELLRSDPRPPGCRALTGRPGHIRIRLGDYRVVYRVQDDVLVVVVVDVGHRRDVYR